MVRSIGLTATSVKRLVGHWWDRDWWDTGAPGPA